MFLSKSNSGYYYVYYKAENGKRNKISTRTKKKSEAISFLTNFKKEILNRRQNGFKSISLSSFVKSYLKYSSYRHQSSTTKDIQSVFKQFQKNFGNPQLTTINKKQVEEYLQFRSKKSKYTSSKDYRYLKAAFNKAKDDGFILDSPLNNIKPLLYNSEELICNS